MIAISEFERLFELIPGTQSFVRDVSGASVEYPKNVWKTVQEHVRDQMLDIEENRKLSNSGKFRVLIGKFLYVQIKSQTAERVMEYLSSRFSTPKELAKTDVGSLIAKFRQLGYRFPNKARTLIEISRILRDRFNGRIDDYVAFADGNYRDDPILGVKGVGFKTRDIALSSFTKKYSLVDVHISNVLSRTGLILRAYLYGFKLTTDRSNEINYLEMIGLLSKLSEEAEMRPFEFDQTLWFFGKDYCSTCARSTVKCIRCPTEKCLTRDFTDFIE